MLDCSTQSTDTPMRFFDSAYTHKVASHTHSSNATDRHTYTHVLLVVSTSLIKCSCAARPGEWGLTTQPHCYICRSGRVLVFASVCSVAAGAAHYTGGARNAAAQEQHNVKLKLMHDSNSNGKQLKQRGDYSTSQPHNTLQGSHTHKYIHP